MGNFINPVSSPSPQAPPDRGSSFQGSDERYVPANAATPAKNGGGRDSGPLDASEFFGEGSQSSAPSNSARSANPDADRELEERGSRHGPPSVLKESLEQGDLFRDLNSDPNESETSTQVTVPPKTANTSNEEAGSLWMWLFLLLPLLIIGGLGWLFWRRRRLVLQPSRPSIVPGLDTSRPVEPIATVPTASLDWSEPTTRAADDEDMLEPEPIDFPNPFPTTIPSPGDVTNEPVMDDSLLNALAHEQPPADALPGDSSKIDNTPSSDIIPSKTETQATATWKSNPPAEEATSSNSFSPENPMSMVPAASLAANAGQPTTSDPSDSSSGPPSTDNETELQELRDELAAAKRQLADQASAQMEWANVRSELQAAESRIRSFEQQSHESYAMQQGMQQQLDQFRTQMRVVEQQRDELQSALNTPTIDDSELVALRTELEQTISQREAIESQRSEMQSSLASLQSELEIAQASATDSVSQQVFADLENQYYTILEERDRLLASQSEVPAVDAELQSELDQLKQTVESQRQTEAELKQALELAESRIVTENESGAQARQLLAEAEQELSEAAAIRQSVETMESRTKDQVQHLELTIREQQVSMERLNTEKEAALERLYQATQKRDELDSVVQQLQATQPAMAEDESGQDAMRAELEQLREALAIRDQQTTKVEGQVDSKATEFLQLQNDYDEQKLQLESLFSEMAAKNDHVAGLEEQLKQTTADAAAAMDMSLSREQTLVELETEVSEKTKTILQLESTLNEREAALNSLQAVVDSRQKELEFDRVAVHEKSQIVQRLESEAEQRDLELERLRNELVQANQESERLTTELVNRKAEQEETIRKGLDASSQLARFESERSETVNQLQSALQRGASLEATLRETEAQLSIAISDADSLTALREELEQEQARIRELQDVQQRRTEQLAEAESQRDTFRVQSEQQREEKKLLESQLAKISQELADSHRSLSVAAGAQSDLELLRDEQKQWQSTIESLQKEHESALFELHSLQREFQEMQTELSDAKQSLVQAQADNKAILDVSARQTDDQMNRLSTERDTAIRAWGAAEQRASDQQSKLREIELNVRSMESDNERLNRHVAELQEYRKQLEQSLSDADARIASRWDDPNRMLGDDEPGRWKAELDEVRVALSENQREKQEIVDRLESIASQNRRMEAIAAEQERTLAELSNEREALQAKVDEQAAVASQSEDDAGETNHAIGELRSALQQQEVTVVNLQRELAERSDELRREKSRPKPAAINTKPLESRLESLELSLSEAATEITRLKTEKRRMSADANSATEEIESLKKSLASSERARKKLEKAREEATTEADAPATSKTVTKKKKAAPRKKSTASKTAIKKSAPATKKKKATRTKRSATTENGATKKRTSRSRTK